MSNFVRKKGPFADAGAFRTPMAVEEICRFANGEAFPVCPRCRVSLEREYQNFCDRCGQRLAWGRLRRAVVTCPAG